MPSRPFSLLGAAAFLLLAALGLPALAHPREVYAPGGDPCSAQTLRDTLAYAILAAFTVAAALAAWTLLTRGRPWWLAAAGVGLLVLGLATRPTTSFGCLSDEVTLATEQGRPWLAVAMAAMTTVGVVLLWLRVARRGDQPTS